MGEREAVCLIDTVDSGAHYRVKGDAAAVAKRIENGGFRELLAFELVRAGGGRAWICAAQVIAVLDPA